MSEKKKSNIFELIEERTLHGSETRSRRYRDDGDMGSFYILE